MKFNARMLKVLACLALSMSVTSGVLSWLDPSLPPSVNALPSDTIVALAREVVAQDVVPDPGRWHEIELVTRPIPTHASMLSAVADPGNWHFRIDVDGRPDASPAWRIQQSAGEKPNAIRICLLVSPDSGGITSSQAICARVLVASLEDMLATLERVPGVLPVVDG